MSSKNSTEKWIASLTGVTVGLLHLYLFVEGCLLGVFILDVIVDLVTWENS